MNQPANPPLVTAAWSPLNPDICAVVSTDPSGGAALVTLSGPMPAPTSDFILRVASAQGGQVDLHAIVHEGTTWDSLAKDFADQINANETLRGANIACQYSGGPLFGVTHFSDNLMVVTPLTGEPLIKVYNGSQAWDAGPTFALSRKPPGKPGAAGSVQSQVDGKWYQVPLPGSNTGQFMFVAVNSKGNDTQYAMFSTTVLNADTDNLQALFQIFLVKTIDGAPLLEEALALMSDGLYIHGKKVVTE